jgi:hypothetical protein
MNFFEIPIQLSEDKGKLKKIYHETNQRAMVQMYRDLLNGTLENYEGIDFKEILTNEILSDPRNKKLWRNFVTGKGNINMNPEVLFKNIEDLLDEWEDYGYWFFIGKGECPTHNTYSAEMNYLKDRSTDVSNELHEKYDMGMQDINVRPRSNPKPKSKSNSNSNSKSKTKKRGQSQAQSQTQGTRQSTRQSARLSQSQKP